VGIAYLIVATWIVFGSEVVTGFVALVALIGTIIHALTSPSDSKDDEKKWFVSLAKRAVQVSKLLKWMTVILWVASLSVTVFGIKKAVTTEETVSVTGLVLTNEKAPIASVLVSIYHGSEIINSQTTKPDGSFAFDKVYLKDNNFRVETQWHGVQKMADLTVELAKKGPFVLVFPATASISPVREFYYDLSGQAIDFLVRGDLSPGWARSIGDQPYIIQNDLLKFLQGLAAQYTVKPDYDLLTTGENDGSSEDPDLKALTDRYKGQSLFEGAVLGHGDAPADNKSLLDGTGGWSMLINGDNERSGSGPYFWRFATKSEVQEIMSSPEQGGDEGEDGTGQQEAPTEKQTISFWSAITDKYYPPHFAQLILWYGACGGWRYELVHKQLYVRVLVLENVSPAPIEVTSISTHHNPDITLRETATDAAVLGRQESSVDQPFPAKLLRPGEKILIPITLILRTDDESRNSFKQPIERRLDWVRQLNGAAFKTEDGITFPNEVLAQYASLNTDPHVDEEFVLGPSISIDSVNVSGDSYAVRRRNPTLLFVKGGHEGASCPYLYTRSSDAESWKSEGTILAGVNNRSKKRMDSHSLERFDGSVEIYEREAEISHIDAMWVDDVDSTGRVIRLSPDDSRLTAVDDNELVLRRGQRVRVRFVAFQPRANHHYILHSVGYYDFAPASTTN
jgi:hypothetical protein